MTKYIIGNRYRRMAHQSETKCRLPFYFPLEREADEAIWEAIKNFVKTDKMTVQRGELFFSVWLELPFNTQFEIEESAHAGYSKVLSIETKLKEDWSSLDVYVQKMHLEELPQMYIVMPSESEEGYVIGRYNFRYNHYMAINRGTFATEDEAAAYIQKEFVD